MNRPPINAFEVRKLLVEELAAQGDLIPTEKTAAIEHYYSHSETSMAFEFLLLEIIERGLEPKRFNFDAIKQTALLYKLNDEDECMIDGQFWPKLTTWLEAKSE